jgi:hypothetical protein
LQELASTAGFRSTAGAVFLESLAFAFCLVRWVTFWSCGSCQCRLIILGAMGAALIGGIAGTSAVAAGFTPAGGPTYATCNRSPFVKVSEATAVPTDEGSALAATNAAALVNETGCCGLKANLNDASAAMPSNRKRPSQTVRIICAPHSRPTLSSNSPTLRQRFEQRCLQIAMEPWLASVAVTQASMQIEEVSHELPGNDIRE